MSDRSATRAEFEQVVLPHLDRLYQYALGLTRNPDEARDVAQDACLRAWRYFGSFRRGAEPRAWLYRILFHAFLAHRRRSGRREQPLPADEAGTDFLLYDRLVREGGWREPVVLGPGRFDRMLGDEVRAAVGRLPAVFRYPVLLADLDELSYAEIARVMDCPVNTVRSRIARARRLLQRDLADYARRNGILRHRRTR